MFDYRLEHVLSFSVTVHKPLELIGETPAGLRMIGYVAGGEVTGPRLSGRIRPGGGDWLTVRPDGVVLLDVRATIETEERALIYIEYSGVMDLGDDGYARVLRGDLPASVRIQIAPRFLTAHPAFKWINRLQCVSVGELDTTTSNVRHDVYALLSG